MCVHLCGRDLTMAQILLDCTDIMTECEKNTCTRMSKIVKTDLLQTSCLDELVKVIGNGVRGDQFAVGVTK